MSVQNADFVYVCDDEQNIRAPTNLHAFLTIMIRSPMDLHVFLFDDESIFLLTM